MSTILQNMPEDEPVYQFLDKKRAEGKPYYVYMTALLAQAVKDAAGAAQPFILDRLGQLCYPPKPPFSDGLFVVSETVAFLPTICLQDFFVKFYFGA